MTTSTLPFDPDDAPAGYIALPFETTGGCSHCDFHNDSRCATSSCMASERDDEQPAIFKRRNRMTLHFQLTPNQPPQPDLHPDLEGLTLTEVDADGLLVAVLTDVEPAQQQTWEQPGWSESLEWDYRIAATNQQIELDNLLDKRVLKDIEVCLTEKLHELREDAKLDAALNRLDL